MREATCLHKPNAAPLSSFSSPKDYYDLNDLKPT